jgi:hypothetical protein
MRSDVPADHVARTMIAVILGFIMSCAAPEPRSTQYGGGTS